MALFCLNESATTMEIQVINCDRASIPGAPEPGHKASRTYRKLTLVEMSVVTANFSDMENLQGFEGLSALEECHADDRFDDAVTVFRQICLDEEHFPTFLTLSAYSQFLVGSASSTP